MPPESVIWTPHRGHRRRRPLGPPLCSTTFGGNTVPPLFVGGGGGGSGGDPVGTFLTWNTDLSGAERLYNTVDGVTFSFSNPQAELIASRIGNMICFNRNNPPSVPKQNNYTSPDGINWTQQNAAAGNIWAQTVGARPNTVFWLQVANVWFVDLAIGSTYFTSTDGISWTIGVFPGASSTIAEDGYMTDGVDDFIIANGIIWATQDGLIWANRGAVSGAAHLVFDPNLTPSYWAFGQSFGNARLYSSPTGVLGTFLTSAAGEASLNATAINWNQILAVARKRGTTNGFPAMTVFGAETGGAGDVPAIRATSPDMVVWTESPASARGIGLRYSGTLDAFVSQQSDFVVGAQNVSQDGINWTTTQFAGFNAFSSFYSSDLLTSFD